KDVCIQNNYRAFDFKTIDERAYTLEREPIFLINKKDRYGSIQIGDVRTATVEKTIVDMIFLVTRKNYPLSGREIGRTIYNILETKSLNIGLMIRYATRRNMSAEVTRILAKLYQRYPHLKVLERFAAREKSIEKVVNEITGEY
ncbi:MAG: hypothetical protein HY929_09235, partial [Euryarchaeota archaeon]|nr:hypothetical protein [Euryarchaeota archaeon]